MGSGRKMSADEFEGTLVRKQEWESTTKKTPCGSRTWIRVYVVLKGRKLNFYIPESAALTYQNEGGLIKSQPALDLAGCTAKVAVDYTKKLHVFRLSLANGAEYLFQASDQEQMTLWVEKINSPSPTSQVPQPTAPTAKSVGELNHSPTPLPPLPPSYDDAMKE